MVALLADRRFGIGEHGDSLLGKGTGLLFYVGYRRSGINGVLCTRCHPTLLLRRRCLNKVKSFLFLFFKKEILPSFASTPHSRN
jgi:hypothetical protein